MQLETNRRARLRPLHCLIAAVLATVTAAVPLSSIAHAAPQAPETAPGDVFLPIITVAPNCPPPSAVEETRFGLQMYGSSQPDSRYYGALLESTAGWLRNEAGWASVEPKNTTPDKYNWASVDSSFAAAVNSEIQIIGTVLSAPAWAATNRQGPIDLTEMSEFAEFAGALAERYDGDGVADAPCSPVINDWEFYNEPDRRNEGGSRSGWGNNGAEYAEMLAAVYPAVKAANPNARIVFGGLAYDWFEEDGGPFISHFLDDVLDAGGGASFDVMNFHIYPNFYPNWSDQEVGLVEKAAAIRSKLASRGLVKPFVITEGGQHSNEHPGHTPMTEEKQARYVVVMLTESVVADIEVMIWWMLYDLETGWPLHTGLYTFDDPPQPKLSSAAFQQATIEFRSAQYLHTLSDDETGNAQIEAHAFRHTAGGYDFYVAWLHSIVEENSAALVLPAERVEVRDIYGASRTVSDSDDGRNDGKVTVTVGGRPVFIEVRS